MSHFLHGTDCLGYFDYYIDKLALIELVNNGLEHMRAKQPPIGCVPLDPDQMVLNKSYHIYGVTSNVDCCLHIVCRTDNVLINDYAEFFPFVRERFSSMPMPLWY